MEFKRSAVQKDCLSREGGGDILKIMREKGGSCEIFL